jgi:hypothetical protein
MKANTLLPKNYSVRPVTEGDLAAVTRLINACSMAEIGAAIQTEQEVNSEWQTPGFYLDTDTWVVLTPDEQIVGYMELWDIQEPHVRLYAWDVSTPITAIRVSGPIWFTGQKSAPDRLSPKRQPGRASCC